MNKSRLGFVFAVVGLAASLQACDLASRDPLSWRLQGGGQLRGLIVRREPTVVVIANPGQSFECYSVLAEWLTWRNDHRAQFLLLYSRNPTDIEARLLRRIRVPTYGILSTRVTIGAAVELLVANDSVLSMHHVEAGRGRSHLLPLIANRTPDGLHQSPESLLFPQ